MNLVILCSYGFKNGIMQLADNCPQFTAKCPEGADRKWEDWRG